MTNEEKIMAVDLIAEMNNWLYHNTNSWEDTELGAEIAYLFAAIATNGNVELFQDSSLLKLLYSSHTFPRIEEDHKVFTYIYIV